MIYAPLYIKTNNSLLNSLIKIEDLISWAKKNNVSALTITDDNMYGVMEFYLACKKNDIKPIIGHEFTIDGFKIILYCQNIDGYHNLIKLSTMNSEKVLTIEDLNKYNKNLVCILPFDSRELKLNFDTIFYGYKNINEKQLLKGNLIYLNETNYIDKSDSNYYPYLESIKTGSLKTNKLDNYLRKESEIDQEYINNNYKLVSMCNVEIKKDYNLLPKYDCPNNLDSYTYLKQLCVEGLKKIFGSTAKKVYIDRLKYELEVIKKMGFCDYFLVVWDYVRFAKENKILVGPGRGSAAGSLVAYVLNITTIDPIKYNLFFERFLNPERVTMPDIDIDFEYLRREEVINYCIKKYGIKRVAQIITFGTLGAKQAIRDVGKSLEIDLKTIDILCSFLDSRLTLSDNYNKNYKLQKYLEENKELQKLYRIATKLEGLKRHISIHAAGVIISSKDLDEVIPLDKSHEEFYTTSYSMNYLEDLGLLKMDFLALKNLTLINDILLDINDPNLTFDSIKENDPKAINIFTTVNTLGIFQFESQGMMNFLNKFKPNTFEDIIASIALFRPGPMDNIDSYIKRKRGLEKIDYIHEDLVNILKPTYGIIIYQEQIMQIATILAGYSLGEADILRRAMSKKKEEILIQEKEKFISRSIDRGYSKEVSEKVYNLILKFASYGFNRAHSVAYSMIAYKMAYLKAYYKEHFMRRLLSMTINSETKLKEYIYETKQNGIKILKPDINLSSNVFTIEGNNLRFPLSGIKNIGSQAISSIELERNKEKFKDIYDFIKRCYSKSVNVKTLESLIKAGCFTKFGYNKRTLIENIDLLLNYGEIIKDLDESLVEKPELTLFEEYDKKTLMKQEQEVFGMYLSNHPVTEYKQKLQNCISLSDLEQYFDKKIETIIYVDKLKEVETKLKEKMVFVAGSDEVMSVDVVIFPQVYQKNDNIEIGSILHIFGRVEKRFDKFQIVVDDFFIYE